MSDCLHYETGGGEQLCVQPILRRCFFTREEFRKEKIMIKINTSAYFTGPLQLAVLDLAGTVLDFGSRAPAGAFVQLFARFGVRISEAQARGPMGMQKRDHIVALCGLLVVQQQWQAATGRAITETDIENLYKAFIPLQLSVLPQYTQLIPGALETVAAMRQRGLRIGLTTGYNRLMLECVRAAAAVQGLRGDVVLCSADTPVGRPAPWMALECARQLNVFPPSACIKIGDTLVDIEEGRNAGMWSVGVTVTGNMLGLSLEAWNTLDRRRQEVHRQAAAKAMLKAGAHAAVDSIGDCLKVVDSINSLMSQGQGPDDCG